ncbi:EamA/RhaT family transporter [Xanthomonas nasturtii]|uniref:EamA/RhaT family transporter n=1 Tax=Xanthomonas nasturtii TaxID=1843581 RepID=A0A3E1KQD4_9XANT|nr:EamA/RhaT family transporter [Xanthomonas nasturtii]MCL1526135.1 EamA/RhaT family transporter [Xanthomonas nasturtii]MCL1528941.1 EamA/RhaT family transporter [Xanthomonas nasturtii]MCL1535112.1 EamA/RhaT family transporter [Xanthomonas nasturtii]MCL1543365.1 EamA/RhaT family transporter [Xanthomonas nasturtii]MCL1550508.1 EamA/RhaT family transporter [Xanthomonas nasturtii]
MHFLLFAVVCSVLVSVLLKLAPRHNIDVFQAITWNYASAALLAWLILHPALETLHSTAAPWLALLLLAVALPSIFLVLARSVAVAGIVRTDVAQRLSLVLPLAAAFTVFGEPVNGWKLAGLALGMVAIMCIVRRPRHHVATDPLPSTIGLPWLIGVWMGFALIDLLLKHIAQAGTPSLTSLTLCFALAFLLMLGVQSVRWARGVRLSTRSMLAGVLLGALNFGNILCYVRAHQLLPHSPATVFASMNLGVVVLGALVGKLGFSERLGLRGWLGLALAAPAIAAIAWGIRLG